MNIYIYIEIKTASGRLYTRVYRIHFFFACWNFICAKSITPTGISADGYQNPCQMIFIWRVLVSSIENNSKYRQPNWIRQSNPKAAYHIGMEIKMKAAIVMRILSRNIGKTKKLVLMDWGQHQLQVSGILSSLCPDR